ncbi:MAG: HupE/UreJ family protein [Oleispira sp.]
MLKKYWQLLGCLILVFSGLFSSQVNAHGIDALGVRVQMAGQKINLVATPSVKVFEDAGGQNLLDDNRDGTISLTEVQAHRQAIFTRINNDIQFINENGKQAEVYFKDVVLAHTNKIKDHSEGAEQLKLVLRYQWHEPPQRIDFRYNLFSSIDDKQAVQVSNLLSQTSQTGTLTQQSNFFRILENNDTKTAQIMAIESTTPLWLSGILHVAEGLDHLLFILILVISTTSFRALILPLSAFTLTHSMTLAAVSFGFGPTLPGWLVEAGITGSIVLMAALEIAGIRFRQLWLVTGGLGFIHGLGFAQALSDSLGGLSVWASSLIQLTLGIELAQLAAALLFFYLLRLIKLNPLYQQALTVSIAFLGMYWTVVNLLVPLSGMS